MSRTFVSVELRDRSAITRFMSAMDELGFLQCVRGRKKGQPLQLPAGMFLLERGTPERALQLTRQALRNANAQARIFCVPTSEDVRFGHLRPIAAA